MRGATLNSPYGKTDRGILQAIGLAVVNYSQVQELLVFGVDCLIIGTLPDGAADLLARRLQTRHLLETFAGLYRHRFPEDYFGDLEKVCNQLTGLNDERNHLIHSFWTPGTAADHLKRQRKSVRQRGPKIWDESVSEADVLRFAEKADKIFVRLMEFIVGRILQRIDDVIPKRRS